MGNSIVKPKNEAAQIFFDKFRGQYDVKGESPGSPKPDASFKAMCVALSKIPKEDDSAVITVVKKPLNNTLINAMTKAFVRNRGIQGLLFSKCDFKEDSLYLLYKLIESDVRIEYFEISQMPMSSEQRAGMINAVKGNENIQNLGLVDLGFTDDDLPMLKEFMISTRTVRVFDFTDNSFTPDGLAQLIEFLELNPSITKITLKGEKLSSTLQARLNHLIERNTAVSTAIEQLLANSCKRNFSTRLSQFRRSLFLRRGDDDDVLTEQDFSEPAYKLYRASSLLTDKFQLIPSKRFCISQALHKGRRSEMQDVALVIGNFRGFEDEEYLAVFDGHGGREPASYCAKHLHLSLATELEKIPPDQVETSDAVALALKTAFLDCNKKMSAFCTIQGTTAVVCYMKSGTFYIAHVGDSRAVLGTSSTQTTVSLHFNNTVSSPLPSPMSPSAVTESLRPLSFNEASFTFDSSTVGAMRLTKDHTLKDPSERAAVESRGAPVKNNRVNDQLSITRALGDSNLSTYISCEPDIYERALHPDDEFIILASDGVWDVVSDGEAVSLVRSALDSPTTAAQKLVDLAFSKNSKDNLSAIIIFFHIRSSATD